MNDLDRFPSLQAFGQQLDERAAHDAEFRARRTRVPKWLWPAGRRRVAVARGAIATAIAVAVFGGAYAAPPTRAAIDDLFSTFADWFAGGESAAPGRAIAPREHVPAWVQAEDGEKRVLAEAGGEKLIAIRQGDTLTLALAASATTATIEEWRKSFGDRHVQLVGAGRFLPNGRHDRRPLFGVVSASVARIEFAYADRGASVKEDDVAGAFGIVVDTNRRPSALIGYDANGKSVARLDFVTDARGLAPGNVLGDFRYCPDASHGCPPWPDPQ